VDAVLCFWCVDDKSLSLDDDFLLHNVLLGFRVSLETGMVRLRSEVKPFTAINDTINIMLIALETRKLIIYTKS